MDNKAPREKPESGKKEIERRRFAEKIERDNRILLDRLGMAMQRKNIDNDPPREGFPTLTQVYRRLELQKIAIENKEVKCVFYVRRLTYEMAFLK